MFSKVLKCYFLTQNQRFESPASFPERDSGSAELGQERERGIKDALSLRDAPAGETSGLKRVRSSVCQPRPAEARGTHGGPQAALGVRAQEVRYPLKVNIRTATISIDLPLCLY